MELFNFIGENISWFLLLFVTLSWVIKETLFKTVKAVIEKPLEIERPQLTVRIDVYEGDTVKIIATDAEGRHMPDILQSEGQEKALKLVGYAKIPTPTPPIEAVREATTTLQGVQVEVPQSPVDEGLDVVFSDEKKEETTQKKSQFHKVVDKVNQKD
jgi:hypothetical protein